MWEEIATSFYWDFTDERSELGERAIKRFSELLCTSDQNLDKLGYAGEELVEKVNVICKSVITPFVKPVDYKKIFSNDDWFLLDLWWDGFPGADTLITILMVEDQCEWLSNKVPAKKEWHMAYFLVIAYIMLLQATLYIGLPRSEGFDVQDVRSTMDKFAQILMSKAEGAFVYAEGKRVAAESGAESKNPIDERWEPFALNFIQQHKVSNLEEFRFAGGNKKGQINYTGLSKVIETSLSHNNEYIHKAPSDKTISRRLKKLLSELGMK